MSSNDTAKAGAAEAANAEATRKRRTITFGQGDDAVEVNLPRKWKRFKFVRAIGRGDIATALEAIWPPGKGEDGEPVDHPTLLALDDLDIDDAEFETALEALAQALGVDGSGNSQASPS